MLTQAVCPVFEQVVDTGAVPVVVYVAKLEPAVCLWVQKVHLASYDHGKSTVAMLLNVQLDTVTLALTYRVVEDAVALVRVWQPPDFLLRDANRGCCTGSDRNQAVVDFWGSDAFLNAYVDALRVC